MKRSGLCLVLNIFKYIILAPFYAITLHSHYSNYFRLSHYFAFTLLIRLKKKLFQAIARIMADKVYTSAEFKRERDNFHVSYTQQNKTLRNSKYFCYFLSLGLLDPHCFDILGNVIIINKKIHKHFSEGCGGGGSNNS